ncbi:ElaB/YqjD/DUF883 family membrane-anchored ribosome-binding protein [Marmoricola sp. OAE513]|uniref:hypothetical protein n=1 Tax=Marmoricola sp. OAE513 TaxID=2817894 RepID=UPI001AE7ACCE
MRNTTIRTFAAVACSVALATSFAGCGSDSKDDKGDSKSLSVAEFKEQANKLCKEADEDVKEIGTTLSATSGKDEVTDALKKAADRVDDEVDDIKDLGIPSSIEDDVEDMLDAVNDATDTIREKGAALLNEQQSPFAAANEKAKALGLDDCADSTQ